MTRSDHCPARYRWPRRSGRDRDRRCFEQRASPGHRPSRCEARQRHADEGRRQAARFRAREVGSLFWTRRPSRRNRSCHSASRPHHAGDDTRHASVHGAGAARRARSRCAHGHLFIRRHALRDDHRTESLRRQDTGQSDQRDSQGSTGRALFGRRRRSYGARSGHREMSRQGSRRPMAERERLAGRVEMDR